jgi:hypothetical protein
LLAAAGVVVEAGLFLFLFLEVGVKYFFFWEGRFLVLPEEV